MSKIKDLVVVDVNLINFLKAKYQKDIDNINDEITEAGLFGVLRFIENLEKTYKPLTPIISDAWNEKDTTLSDYLLEKEI